ncbi:MAG TPA: TIGR00730 family Rossman fold protein [Bacteroidetes bacterium]|nr:TIGR00730 family Rossman fold protein [Bacteroidota bacterium]
MKKVSQVCVYCASSDKVDAAYFEATDQLAEAVVAAGASVIYGGGGKGLMGHLADGVLARKGTIIGVIPEFMKKVEWDHPHVTELRVVPDMHTRKRIFLEGTDAIVALPGGCGTFEELLEAMTWKRLGLVTCPIIIVNTNGYYDPLLAMLDRSVDENFMRAEHRGIWSVIDHPNQLMEAIENAPEWSENAIGFAAV